MQALAYTASTMSNENDTNEPKAHPFELANMGIGPYRWVGMWSFPSAYLAEMNPTAYNLALSEMPKHLKNGCGTCAHCGMAITNVCIIRDGHGDAWGVGCDCVKKTDDPSLGDGVKVALAQHNARVRREANERKRAAQHKAWLAKVCNDKGETNQQRLEREEQERKAQESAEANRRFKVAAVVKHLGDAIRDGKGGFCDSIANDLCRGILPTGRGLSITIDILAKMAGRRNSRAYDEDYSRITEIFEHAASIK